MKKLMHIIAYSILITTICFLSGNLLLQKREIEHMNQYIMQLHDDIDELHKNIENN